MSETNQSMSDKKSARNQKHVSNDAIDHRPRRRWPGWLAGALVVLCLLLTGAYFYISSFAFFNHWIRPRLEGKLERSIVIESYRFSPFGELRLGGLQVQKRQGEEVDPLQLKQLDLHFKLLPLLNNRVEIQKLFLDSFQIHITKEADGTLRGPFPVRPSPQKKRPAETKQAPKPTPSISQPDSGGADASNLPMKIELANVDMRDINLTYETYSTGEAAPQVYRIEQMSVSTPRFSFDRESTLDINGMMSARLPRGESPSEQFSGRLQGSVKVAQADNGENQVNTDVEIADVSGMIQGLDLSTYRFAGTSQIALANNNEQIRLAQANVSVQSDREPLAQIDMSGQLNVEDGSGEIDVQVHPLDRRVLNLIGAPRNIDFRDTQVSGEATVAMGAGGNLQKVKVDAKATNLNPRFGEAPQADFPATNVQLNLEGGVESPDGPFMLRELLMEAVQTAGGANKIIISARLNQPLALDNQTFLPKAGGVGADVFNLRIDQLNLPQWQGLLGSTKLVDLQSGNLSADLKLGADPSQTERLALNGTVNASTLKGTVSDLTFGPLSSDTNLDATFDANARVDISQSVTTLRSGDRNLGKLAVNGYYAPAATQNPAKLDFNVSDLDLLPWIKWFELAAADMMPKSAVVNGSLNAELPNANTMQTSGNLDVRPFVLAGASQGQPDQSLPMRTEFQINADLAQSLLNIEPLKITLDNTQQNAGFVNLNGQLNYSETPSGDLKLVASQLLLAPLAPFIAQYQEYADLSGSTANGTQDIQIRSEQGTPLTRINGSMNVSRVTPLNDPYKQMGLIDLAITNEFIYRPPTLDIKQLNIEVYSGNEQPDRIQSSGQLKTGDATTGRMQFRSDNVNLKPLLPYAEYAPSPNAPQLTASNVSFDLQLKPEELEVQNLSANVNEGKVACRTFSQTYDPPAPGSEEMMRWEGLSASDLDVPTMLANLAPQYLGYLTGTITLNSSGSACGFDERSLSRCFRGQTRATVKNGEILNNSILRELVRTTGIGELQQIFFLRLDSEFQARENGLNVEKFEVIGDLQKINLTGRVNYDRRLDLSMNLALGGKLRELVSRTEYAKYLQSVDEKYIVFPTPLGIAGTTTNPRIALRFPTETVVETGLDILRGELRDYLNEKLEEKRGEQSQKPAPEN